MRKFLLSLGVLTLSTLVMAVDYQSQPMKFGYLNNTDNPLIIAPHEAQDMLNTYISDSGSIIKRDGYGLAFTLGIDTSPIHGIYSFYDTNGSDVMLFFNDSRLEASISGGSLTTVFSTSTYGVTWDCTDHRGKAYCLSSSNDNLIQTDGDTYTEISAAPVGTMVTSNVERLIIAGINGNPDRIDFSARNDFTSWTLASAPEAPIQFNITAPGSKITHIANACNGTVWFKQHSFGLLLEGETHIDWQNIVISASVGTFDNSSVYREGVLYFRGQDGSIYGYNCSEYNKLTNKIEGTTSVSQSRIANSWTQTTQSDFSVGISTPVNALSTTTVSGDVVISTDTSVISQLDTSSANFAGGTLSGISTTAVNGSLVLTGSPQTKEAFSGGGTITSVAYCSDTTYAAQQFRSASAYTLVGFDLSMKKFGTVSSPEGYFALYSDGGNVLGSLLSSVSGVDLSSIGTGATSITITLDDRVNIANDTDYWIYYYQTAGTCSSPSNYIGWMSDYGDTYSDLSIEVGATPAVLPKRHYTNNGLDISATGTFTSRVFDVTHTTNTILWNWCELDVNGTLTGSTAAFETETSSANDGGDTWEALVSVSTGNSPTSTVQQYMRYKITMDSTDDEYGPQIDDVKLHACLIPSYLSDVHNAESITSWNTFIANKIDNGGEHIFYIRAKTSSFSEGDATPVWTTIVSGNIPSISTGTYFQIRDDFSITKTTQIPSLQEFTQNWYEGAASDKAYAIYFDDAIWWSIASGEGSSTNNTILVFDLINIGWTKYDIPSNGLLVRNNELYFGDSSGGFIYKYGDGNTDNGTDIEAYWKSKDFTLGSPFVDKDFRAISTVFEKVSNSSVTVTYTHDGTESSYVVPLEDLTKTFVNSNRLLPIGVTGKVINIKYGNDASDQPFEVIAGMIDYRAKPWRPE